MKRDVQEGQARCLAHLGRHQEALEIAANLVSGSRDISVLYSLKSKLPAKSRIEGWDYRKKLSAVSLLT